MGTLPLPYLVLDIRLRPGPVLPGLVLPPGEDPVMGEHGVVYETGST